MHRVLSYFRRPRVLLAIIVACVIAAVAIAIFVVQRGAQTPSSTNDTVATPQQSTPGSPGTASPIPNEAQPPSGEEATAVLTGAFDAISADLATPETASQASSHLGGNALESHQALVEQWSNEGLHQEGKPSLVQADLIEGGDSRQLWSVCVDTSQVRVLDENGVPMAAPEMPQRTRFVVTLEKLDGTWKLTDETFAEDPQC
ncbi:hypothetical protein [Schaalia suimastitidis]|uniref:hypothetical protein n=1 Tax=Schaalia suimastitidis TaxID=121163 RepID=UPI0003F535DB|nr:hypothetical protein [Schaalia suimastitidis]